MNTQVKLNIILLLKAILFCFFSSQVVLSQSLDTNELLEQIDQEVMHLMQKGDIPGLSVVIVQDNQEIVRNYGFANVEEEIPVSSNTLFELGSCSKAFTALAVMRLVKEKKIDLEDKVSKYVPWLSLMYEREKVEITIQQLLHHTTGIPWTTISKIPEGNDENALEHTVQNLVGQELKHYPGEKFEYATINYDVLALIIQKVSGETFEDYLKESIIRPLGLTSTTIGTPIDTTFFSKGYKIGFFKPRTYNAPRFKGNNAAGYVISNSVDIAKWLKLQLGIIPSELYDLMLLTQERDRKVPLHNMSAYAMGWEVSLNGTEEIQHSGQNPNFTSHLILKPKQGIGVGVLANSNSTYTPIIGDIIMKVLTQRSTEIDFDPGDRNDKTFSILSMTIGIYIFAVLAFLIWLIIDVVKGKRKYEGLSSVKLKRYVLAIVKVIPFLYGLYLLPMAMAKFDWNTILIWTPISFSSFVDLTIAAIAISYVAHLISLFFPHENEYKRIGPQLLLMSILSGVANVVVIIMVTSAIGSDIPFEYILLYFSLTLGVYLLGRRFVQINLVGFTRGLVYDLRLQLITKILSSSFQKFEKIEKGRVYTALNDDVTVVGGATHTFMNVFTSTITALGAFLYLTSIAFWGALVVIFFILIMVTLFQYQVKRTNVYFEEARDERNVFMNLVSGMIEGYKEISLQRKKRQEFKQDIANSADTYRKKTLIADIHFVNAFLVGELILILLLGLVAFGIPEFFPSIKIYTVLNFVVVLLYLIGPINRIVDAVPIFMEIRVAWNRIHKFLGEVSTKNKMLEVQHTKVLDVESIEAKGVSFKYGHGQTAFEVGPIDLKVEKGEILFIIGGNGSGKTTFAKLLTGLYEATHGEFKINGIPIESSELGEYFSTVFSPSYLFEKLYNVNTAAEEGKVQGILKRLDLAEKVQIENNTYSTIDLSGGQRKRLALLQCFLEDSPIYLFDELAADQDPVHRNFFYKTLLPEMKRNGKIVIAITHDDHYFEIADKVMKMDQGQLKLCNDDFLLYELPK
ncbi:cyclic peptide export ABC transporter [Spongiimicrobium salis]|uniref:cyclic peptide export ABC transporter n=1 Tax=Spongiimicrobium salis TaxID=1667022 RepID=UPI00374C9477